MSQKPFSVEVGYEIQDDNGRSQVLRGVVDPSQGAGVAADESSLYILQNGANSALFQKTGPADTDWTKMATGSQAGLIGAAEDGSYADGLFTDFTPETPTGTAIDRFNELFKAVAPPPAPALTGINSTTSGVTAKLSFGPSNVVAGYTNVDGTGPSAALDVNSTFSVSGDSRGILDASTNLSGVLADNNATHDYAYPANAFGDGDSGTLELELNGVVVQTVDLSAFVSGNSVNANGSGFNLSAATSVSFQGGDPFDQFKYRTGTYIVGSADMRNGYNYVRVLRDGSPVTNYVDWVVDADTTAMVAVNGALDAVNLTGSKYLSGVQYHTAGSAQYDVTIENAHMNVYPTGNAITFTETNGSVSNLSFGNITLHTEDEVITNAPFTITNSGRILGGTISCGVNVSHPLKANLSNQQNVSVNGIWIDNVSDADTSTSLKFNEESKRLLNPADAPAVNNYNDQADIASGAWDSSVALDAATAGYASGLLVYNGSLRYPTEAFDGGDFRNVSDGNVNGPAFGPAGNPNYELLSGDRVAVYEFTNNSGSTKANFKINVTGTGGFASAASGNNFKIEVKFPNGSLTTGTGWMDAYADFATNQFADGDGMRNAAQGAGRAMGVDWGLTVGTKSIANGEKVLVRITAADTNTGQIDNINLTWL